METSKIRIIIVGFNDYISLYRVVTTKNCSKDTIEDDKSHSDQLAYQLKKEEVNMEEDVQIDKLIDTHMEMNH